MNRDVAFAGMKSAIDQWKSAGLALIGIGLLAVVSGFLFDPTIEAQGFTGDRVVNLHGLSIKFALLVSGAAASISGLICLAVSSIIRVLRASAAINVPDQTKEALSDQDE